MAVSELPVGELSEPVESSQLPEDEESPELPVEDPEVSLVVALALLELWPARRYLAADLFRKWFARLMRAFLERLWFLALLRVGMRAGADARVGTGAGAASAVAHRVATTAAENFILEEEEKRNGIGRTKIEMFEPVEVERKDWIKNECQTRRLEDAE